MEIVVRPLTADDIEAAGGVQSRSFDDYDRRHGEAPKPWTEGAVARQRQRFEHFLKYDPEGSWVAVAGDSVVGTALASKRDAMWGLSLLAVDPETQSSGIGRRLLAASLQYAAGATTAVILSSEDTRAMRAYARAGFDLHPQVSGRGTVDRTAIPRLSRVRKGDESRADWADAVDRAVRGAGRGPDHAVLISFSDMYVIDDADGRGYAYIRREDSRIATVIATDDDTSPWPRGCACGPAVPRSGEAASHPLGTCRAVRSSSQSGRSGSSGRRGPGAVLHLLRCL
jgi:GNAT superfamily N-acetyltransferase